MYRRDGTMNKKPKKRFFTSIRSKIILAIYLVIFLVLIVVTTAMYTRNSESVTKENTRQYQNTVDVLNESIGYFEQDLLDIFTYVIVNPDVKTVLKSPQTLGFDDPLFWSSLSPMRFVTDMINVKGDIRTFILYPENGLSPYYNSLDGSVMIKDIETIREQEIYNRAVLALGNTVWDRVPAGSGGVFEKNKHDKILLAREIFDASKSTRLGFMSLSIDVSQYEQICQKSLLYPDEGIVIVDGDFGQIAHVGNVDLDLMKHLKEINYPNNPDYYENPYLYNNWFVFASPRGVDGWVFYLTPKQSWDEKMNEGLVLPITLALVLLICILPLSIFASRVISRPLASLHDSMNKFKEGDFSQQVEVTGNDEITALSHNFNAMVQDMKAMIDINYVMALREKESELDALQAQMNPHFLYNALDSLYWQAVEIEQNDLAENILSMSKLFRLVLSSGQSQIQVSQEIKLITHYLQIQKMRFGKKLDYTISVEEDMMEYLIPKLILQPFVENAIVHGLERQDRWVCVQIRGEIKDDMLYFIISDNGTGMEMEKVEEILFASEDKRYANQRVGRFAIRNVKERMSLSYGDKVTLDIQSEVGKGTRVSITMPKESINSYKEEKPAFFEEEEK